MATPIPENPWLSFGERQIPHRLPGVQISVAGHVLDEQAFMAEVEPVPAFLSQPIADRAAEIEALLRFADEPYRPQRRWATG